MSVSDLLNQFELSGNSTNISSQTSLLGIALTIQSKLFPCVLSAAGVLLVLAICALVILKRDLKSESYDKRIRRQEITKLVLMTLIWGSLGIALSSAVAITEVAAAMEYATALYANPTFTVRVGHASEVCHWLIIAFSALYAFGILFVFKPADGNVKYSQKPYSSTRPKVTGSKSTLKGVKPKRSGRPISVL
jgi:hypothetical protein